MTTENIGILRRAARNARDLWIYFKSGHSGYFTFILSLSNFVVLQYNLLIERIPLLKQIAPRMYIFILLFSFVYFPIAILVGYYDMKRGATMRRPFLTPYTQDTLESNIKMRRSLMHFYNGENEKALTELEESERLLTRWKSDT